MADSPPTRDWLVTFARKVAEQRDYSHRHPGYVFKVMLSREEAEGLLAEWATEHAAVHMCETDEGEWRPCPAALCEASRLNDLRLAAGGSAGATKAGSRGGGPTG